MTNPRFLEQLEDRIAALERQMREAFELHHSLDTVVRVHLDRHRSGTLTDKSDQECERILKEPQPPKRCDDMSDDLKRWECECCHEECLGKDILTAPSPFDPSDTLHACPHCKSIDGFNELCEEPGCRYEATCGTPFGTDDYKRHCHRHPPKATP